MRNFIKRAKYLKKQLTLKSAVQAWRQENRAERGFTNRVVAFGDSVKQLNLKQAFDLIKRYSLEKTHLQKDNKLRSREVLINACKGYFETKLRASFNKWR